MHSVTALILALIESIAAPVGASVLGISGEFANRDPSVSERTAPALVQRGINAVLLNMRGAEGGLFNWTKVHKVWQDSKAVVFWDAPSTFAECDRIQGFGEDAVPMGSEAFRRGVGLFSSSFVQELRRVATAVAFRLRSTAGYRVPVPTEASAVESERDAVEGWRRFLQFFFGDRSPHLDTNGDTATYSSAYAPDCCAWDEVSLFDKSALDDDYKTRLVNLWFAKSQADYAADMCGSLAPLTKLGLNGPHVRASADASVMASKKRVSILFTDEEASVPFLDCAAALFGKKIIAVPVKLVPGDRAKSRAKLLRMLPYVDGAFVDFDSVGRYDESSQVLTLDTAFEVVSQLAPFVGRFRAERIKLLWIVPEGIDTRSILDAYCVTESALALEPDCVDLTRFTAVIYLNLKPSISTVILQKLFDYAVKGGIVFIDAYRIGQGKTLHGRDNAQFWWHGLKLGRGDYGEGETTIEFAGRKWIISRTLPYLAAEDSRVLSVGKVTDCTGEQYPLLLVRPVGKSGKWVYINVPDLLWDGEALAESDSFALLKCIVKSQAGIDLPDPSRARTYVGDGCAMAIGGLEPEKISIPCKYNQAVVFDIDNERAAILQTSGGNLALPDSIGPGDVRIWAVKPYGKPIVLYTDGVSEWAGSLDDGVDDGNSLKFNFARRAVVSSPEAPKLLLINGEQGLFDYDPQSKLVKIVRSDKPAAQGPAKAELRY